MRLDAYIAVSVHGGTKDVPDAPTETTKLCCYAVWHFAAQSVLKKKGAGFPPPP